MDGGRFSKFFTMLWISQSILQLSCLAYNEGFRSRGEQLRSEVDIRRGFTPQL